MPGTSVSREATNNLNKFNIQLTNLHSSISRTTATEYLVAWGKKSLLRPYLGKTEVEKITRFIKTHKINNGLVGIDETLVPTAEWPKWPTTSGRFFQDGADHPVLMTPTPPSPRVLRGWNQLPHWTTDTPSPEAYIDSGTHCYQSTAASPPRTV